MAKENFLNRNWHSITAVIFLAVVVLDLIIFPLWYQFYNSRISVVEMVQLASTFKDGASQLAALKILHDQTAYVPFTLTTVGGSMFYTSFAAILGVSAWTKGNENVATINANVAQPGNGQ